MHILLPPSEGKTVPSVGPRLDLARLAAPDLTSDRQLVLTSLIRLCQGSAAKARAALGLGPRQDAEIVRNAGLAEAPTTSALSIYTGVLYDALDPGSLTPAARRRAGQTLWVQSALFGIVAADDPIAAYRLSADSTLPTMGTMSRWWASRLYGPMNDQFADGPIVDLRSGAYQAFWTPPEPERCVSVRVLTQFASGKRSVVSHHNKATKGALARTLVSSRRRPRDIDDIADLLAEAGFVVELVAPTKRSPWQIDVILTA